MPCTKSRNPTNGSCWIVQVPPTTKHSPGTADIPPTAVGGVFKSCLVGKAQHQQPHFCGALDECPKLLNSPSVRRLDLNHPPTPVGGIWIPRHINLCRSNLNHPPTAVGG